MTSFAASLVACTGIIALGYFAGRILLIDEKGTSSIGVFAGRFALPSLLFTELANLSLNDVDMRLLVSVTVAKVTMFAAVLGCSMTFDYRGSRLAGTSALRAIFCTQSNDFALGLPVATALFNDKLVSMIYLLSPISLLLLNPIGFVLLGYSAAKAEEDSEEGESSGRGSVLGALFRVAKTPIVACTVAGVVWNVIIGRGTVPSPISFMLETIGGAFTPCALFFTGLSLVGKVNKLTPDRLLLPATLTVCKVIVMPIVIYLAVGLAGGDSEARGFGFVYGAVPTAPSVLVYAQEYVEQKGVEQIAVSLVLCTLAATPVLFVAGILVNDNDRSTVETNARVAALYLSIQSAVVSTYLLATFAYSWYQDRLRQLERRRRNVGTWRQADTRVLLLVVIAGAHALGSSNAASCFAKSQSINDGQSAGRFAHYFIASFCRLASCGAAAASALLPEVPGGQDSEDERRRQAAGQKWSRLFCFCVPFTQRRKEELPQQTSTTVSSRSRRLETIFSQDSDEQREDLAASLLEPCDEVDSRWHRTRMQRALMWSVSLPFVISASTPLFSTIRSQSDACGYTYGAAQFAGTSVYLALCVALSLVGLKRTRRIVDVRYRLLQSASATSLQRLSASDPSPQRRRRREEQEEHEQRRIQQQDVDDLPGGSDTIGSSSGNLAALAAMIAREERAARGRGETWTQPTPQDRAAAQCSTKLVTAIGHRMMLLIILHVLYALIVLLSCLSHLAPDSAMATTKVVELIEATLSSSMGIIVFFIFGLTPNQPLVARALGLSESTSSSSAAAWTMIS